MSNFGKMKSILIKEPLKLDCGKEISNFPLAYETYGELNENKDSLIKFILNENNQDCNDDDSDKFINKGNYPLAKEARRIPWPQSLVAIPDSSSMTIPDDGCDDRQSFPQSIKNPTFFRNFPAKTPPVQSGTSAPKS